MQEETYRCDWCPWWILCVGILTAQWDTLYEFPMACEHPVEHFNRTGQKVMIVGAAKTGTRTISHTLNDLGIRTYHSEDFALLSYNDWITEMRAKNSAYWHAPIDKMFYLLGNDNCDASIGSSTFQVSPGGLRT